MTGTKSIPGPSRDNERYSVSTEKISNGFLIHESHSSGNKWTEKTTYSATRPKMSIPSAKPSSKGRR